MFPELWKMIVSVCKTIWKYKKKLRPKKIIKKKFNASYEFRIDAKIKEFIEKMDTKGKHN